jgi:hypothetical protein
MAREQRRSGKPRGRSGDEARQERWILRATGSGISLTETNSFLFRTLYNLA